MYKWYLPDSAGNWESWFCETKLRNDVTVLLGLSEFSLADDAAIADVHWKVENTIVSEHLNIIKLQLT